MSSSSLTMKDLACVSKCELDDFFDSFDVILCDIDGVILFSLHIDALEGAIEAIKTFKNLNKSVKFVSNNCSRGSQVYLTKLQSLGLDLSANDLLLPIQAIIDHLKSIDFDKEAYVLATQLFKDELRNAGIKVAKDGPQKIEETTEEFLRHLKDNPNVGAVIIDTDINVNLIKLQKALIYLKRKDVIFIKGASLNTVMLRPTFEVLGPGYFQRVLEEVSGRQAISLAKPSKEYSDFVTKKCKIKDASRVLFIGDSISIDMEFAAQRGYKKLLVLTGTSKLKDVEKWRWREDLKPDYYVESLGSVPELMKAKRSM